MGPPTENTFIDQIKQATELRQIVTPEMIGKFD